MAADTPRSNPAPSFDDLAASFREQAESLVRDAETLTTTTLDHARQVAAAVGQSAYALAQRSQHLAADAWKTWSDATAHRVAGVNFPSVSAADFQLADVRATVAAGVDMAKDLLDAQRELANRLVGAVTSNAR